MKISKLFHWLYAILMFLPFGLLLFNALASMWSGNTIDLSTWSGYFSDIFPDNGSQGLWTVLLDVYNYLVLDLFELDLPFAWLISDLLIYWTCISIIWLVFDVFMYLPLLVHRWIDKAKIE